MAKKKAATKKTTRKKSAVKKSTKKKATKKKSAKKKTTGKKTATKKATPRKATKKKTSRKKAAKGNGARRFELVDGSSSKFWEVSQNGSEFTVRYGRIGTDGQAPKTKDMGTSEKAAAEVEKLIRAKTGKGYAETTNQQPATKKKVVASSKSPKKRGGSKTSIVGKDVLTVEIAKRFLRKWQDLDTFTSIETDAAEMLSKCKREELALDGLANLSDAAAEGLSKHKGDWLGLNGLTSLSGAAAKSLSKHKGDLHLNGLTSLSDAAAEGLSKHKGEDLYLNGMTSLSDAAAESLSKHKGDLYLNGLTSLSDAAAEGLRRHGGSLYLEGLTSLSDSPGHVALAESLSKSEYLLLDGLTSLSDAAAESFSKHRGWLNLGGLKSLSDAAAESLSKHRDQLCLGLTKLSDHQARSLGNRNGPDVALRLCDLKTLSGAAAAHLGKSKGDCIDLRGLRSLSSSAAYGISSFPGTLELSGLKTLSAAAAEALSRHKGSLWLEESCLESLSREAFHAISGHADIVPRYLSAAMKAKLRKARTAGVSVLDSLVKARNAGATSLRTVWEGFGDDGCFEHTFLKNGKPIKPRVDPDSDIEGLIEEKEFSVCGECNGSVGLLEIDLVTGEASFWEDDSQPLEEGRFAEFLVKCEWQHTTQLTADIKWKREGTEAKISGISSTPKNAAKLLKQDLSILLYRLEGLEGGDEELLEDKVRRQCGMSVSLVIDVPKRSFVFSGNGKRVTVKVPKNTLSVTRFQVDLGTASSTKKRTKGKK